MPETSNDRVPCILKVEKTPFGPGEASSLAAADVWSKAQTVRPFPTVQGVSLMPCQLPQVTANDIYSTSLAWFAPGRANADVQLSSICPATEKVGAYFSFACVWF